MTDEKNSWILCSRYLIKRKNFSSNIIKFSSAAKNMKKWRIIGKWLAVGIRKFFVPDALASCGWYIFSVFHKYALHFVVLQLEARRDKDNSHTYSRDESSSGAGLAQCRKVFLREQKEFKAAIERTSTLYIIHCCRHPIGRNKSARGGTCVRFCAENKERVWLFTG